MRSNPDIEMRSDGAIVSNKGCNSVDTDSIVMRTDGRIEALTPQVARLVVSSIDAANAIEASIPPIAIVVEPASDEDFLDRRRLMVILAAAIVLNLCNSAFDVITPLWSTSELGLHADDWAQLRSLRFIGTLAGTIVIGVGASRFGPRVMAAACLFAAGLDSVLLGLIGKPFLMAAFPLWGANISAAYVALNTLVNSLPPERQVKANGMYRAVSSGISVVAPMLATAIASKLGNGVSIIVFGSGMCIGAVLMYWYPSESDAMSGKKQTPIGWLGVVKQPGLLRFMAVDQWFALGTTSISAFQTLRLARDLELGDSSVGVVISSGLGFNFLGTLAAAPLQERFSERIALAVSWFSVLIGALFLSLSTAWWTAAIGVCAAGFGSGLYMAPSSVTIARLGGGSPNAAKSFTIWKVAQGTTWVVSMQICAALEASVGMATTIGIGALLSVLPWLLLLSGRVQLEVPSPEPVDQ